MTAEAVANAVVILFALVVAVITLTTAAVTAAVWIADHRSAGRPRRGGMTDLCDAHDATALAAMRRRRDQARQKRP